MALLKQYTETKENFTGTLSIPNAYWRVNSVSGDKVSCQICVGVYPVADGALVAEKNYYFKPSMNGSNFIAQAYNHLKTLPAFAGATDC
jgi:hypothetical protein